MRQAGGSAAMVVDNERGGRRATDIEALGAIRWTKEEPMSDRGIPMRGAGRATFAAVLLLIVGTLNIVYGIGALDSANIFTNERRYILTNLNALGWVLIILGVIQLTGGFSLMAGNTYGRVIGIAGGSLGAIGALFSIGGSNPWWSLAIFFLCVWIIYGILILGPDGARAAILTAVPAPSMSAGAAGGATPAPGAPAA